MKAPKRTPWSSRSELEELYEMLFSPNSDTESRRRGVARMSIYISSPSCPTFIHLLHSLVSVELLPYPPKGIEENQRSRMMIAMAIVRFINGLVDPLQNGPYARPISHLALQLSIPPSLISLRHRATHEDLPPLGLLHQSLISCITYLHHYSFLPLLSSSSSFGGMPPGVMERLELSEKRIEGLIRKWKKVIKARLREKEVREEDKSAIEIRKIKRLLQNEEMSLIVRVLVGEGGLVPIAIQKRANLSSNSPTIPSLKIWLPLLKHLQETSHPETSIQLSSKILDILLNPNEQINNHNSSNINGYFGGNAASTSTVDLQEKKEDKISFRWNLAVWLIYFYGIDSTQEEGSSLGMSRENKDEIVRRILGAMIDLHDDVVVRRLFKALQDSSSNLDGLDNLLPEIQDEEEDGLKGLEMDIELPPNHGLEEMEERLKQFENIIENRKSIFKAKTIQPSIPNTTIEDKSNTSISIQGWRKLTNQEWNPCPIGSIGTA